MSIYPKSLGRVPIIPLSYEEKDRAVAKELVADYETGNIYIKNSNGEFINVFQAAMKIDNQWLTASARLNNGRAWNVTAGTANNALVAGGITANSKVLDTVEAWDGSSWRIDSTEDFGLYNDKYNTLRFTGGCGTRDSMLFARIGAVYKYENATATLLTSSGVGVIDAGSFDVCGNSTQSLFRNSDGLVGLFNSITKIFELYSYNLVSCSQTISEESFGTANGAIIIGNTDTTNTTVKYDANIKNFAVLNSPNIYRNRFGSAGENTTSGMIFGGCNKASDYFDDKFASSVINTTEEWINGSTWKVSSNMEYALGALDGCGTAQGGIAMGGFLSDGSVSTYTERFSNVDGLTYLKSIRDDMSAVIDAISDKTIGSTFDSFLSTNASIGASFEVVGTPGIGTKQEKATIATFNTDYLYSKLTKNLTVLEDAMNLNAWSYYVFTSGVTDDAPDYIVNQNYQTTRKRTGITTSTLAFNPFYLSNKDGYDLESTGKQAGVGRASNSVSKGAAYIRYDFDNSQKYSPSSYPLIQRAGGFGGGNNMELAYFCGGRTHDSSLYYTNAEKFNNNTVSAIGNASAYHFTLHSGQANMMKYGNDFIVYGDTIEKLNTLTDTWSTENYRSAYTSNFSGANGNTSAFGLGSAISGYYLNFEEFYHGGVIETLENILDQNSANINTKNAEKIEYPSEDTDIDYVAGTKEGTSKSVLVDTEQFFNILCNDIPHHILDYTGLDASDGLNRQELKYIVDWMVYDYTYIDEDGTPWYDYSKEPQEEFIIEYANNDSKLSDRIQTIENILIKLFLGNTPVQYGMGGYYRSNIENGADLPDDKFCNINSNARDFLLNLLVNDCHGIYQLTTNHMYGTSHPSASSSQAGYMSTTHYNLLNNATSTGTTANTLVKRDGGGRAYIATPGSFYTSSSGTGLYMTNCYYVYRYFIRNSTAGSDTSTTQTLGTMLQAVSNTNYTTRQVRNIVFWTSGNIPTTQNGDIIIKTF